MKEVLFASFPGIKNRKRDRQFEYPPSSNEALRTVASPSYFFVKDAEITTEVGENARPCTPWKPVTTGVTTPVFRSTRPISLTSFAAV